MGFVYGWTLLTDLGDLLDRVASLKEAGELGVIKDDLGDGPDDVAGAVRTVLADRDLRPEHRARIYEDLIANRELLDGGADPRIILLMVWSEHVERLHAAVRKGGLTTFHYARALEATCRRVGFELLPVMDRMEELGKFWAGRKYEATYKMLAGKDR